MELTPTIRILLVFLTAVIFVNLMTFYFNQTGMPIKTNDGDIATGYALFLDLTTGISIAVAILIYSDLQQKQNTALVKQLNEILKKQNESADARKKFAISEVRKCLTGAKNTINEYEQLKANIAQGNTSTTPNFARDLEVHLRGLRIAFNGMRFYVTTYAEAFDIDQTSEIHLIASEGLGYAGPEQEGVAKQTSSNLIREIDALLQMLPEQ